MATRLTTICCSALALILLTTDVGSAQRRVKQTHAADDKTPAALFPLQTLWTLQLNNSLTAAPAFDATRGFFPLEGDQLAAYNLVTGDRLWIASVHTTFEPAAGDELVFVVRETMKSDAPSPVVVTAIAALRATDGRSAWELPFADALAAPPVWDNGWLIVSTMDGQLRAYRATDGTLIWQRDLGSPAHAKPALAGDAVYVSASDSRVVAMRIDTGALLWERRLGGAGNDILADRNRLFLGSQDRYFYCLNAEDGTVDWRWQTGGPVIGLPVVDDRTVYFVSLDNVLRALNRSSGVQRWKTSLSLRPATGPLHAADSLVISGPAPTLRAFKMADGKSAGEFALPGELAAPPHVFTAPSLPVPVVIAIARDIVKGRTAIALTRSFDPTTGPLTPLPNLIPVNPTATPSGPAPSASPPPRP